MSEQIQQNYETLLDDTNSRFENLTQNFEQSQNELLTLHNQLEDSER